MPGNADFVNFTTQWQINYEVCNSEMSTQKRNKNGTEVTNVMMLTPCGVECTGSTSSAF